MMPPAASPLRRPLCACHWIGVAALAAGVLLLWTGPAAAQTFTLDFGQNAQGSTTGRVVQLFLLLTILSVAPAIFMMVTAFTRIVVVLSILRRALGTNTSPPNTVVMSLAIF